MSYYSTPVMLSGAKTQGAPSLIENQQSLASPINQHFVEWFSGDALDSIWTLVHHSGSGSGAMSDTVGGGYAITTGASNGDNSMIGYNDTGRHFNGGGSAFIATMARTGDTSMGILAGLTSLDEYAGTASDQHFALRSDTNTTSGICNLLTRNGTTGAGVDGATTPSTEFNTYKAQIDSTSCRGWLNGGFEMVQTGASLPTSSHKLQPSFRVITRTTAAKTGNICYFEAYNTG